MGRNMKEQEVIDLALVGISRQLATLDADLSEMEQIHSIDNASRQKYGKLEDGLEVCRDLMNQIAEQLRSGSK